MAIPRQMEVAKRTAHISPCGRYRYKLTREFLPFVLTESPLIFCMLNPSTADADIDDPTIRRCMGFAKREHKSGIIVVNLYPLRATDPKKLKTHVYLGADAADTVNCLSWADAMLSAPEIVCAWGNHAALDEVQRFMRMARVGEKPTKLVCLGVNKNGSPKHPLYVKADAPLVPYTP